VLGVEDYGIYSVVGGIVSLFSFLSGTMASATQRFFSFALGQNNSKTLKKTFSVNLIIYAGIAILAFLLLETVGTWYVTNKLKVPPERFEVVLFIFHFSVLTFITIIFASPFKAIIIAHEDMQIYAYVSIIEAALKLIIVFLLIYLPWDKLEIYGFLLFLVALINTLIYVIICIKNYSECQFRKFYWDKFLLNKIIGFTGWTLFGQITTVFRNQAVTILLNQAFNPIIVAARAIATNVANQINLFSSNFNVGLYPPIIKSYASGNKENMFYLIFNGSKITFFLLWLFALPMFLEMDTILNLWLKNPPQEAILFTRLALVEVLINSISLPIVTAARAPGKMKIYETTLGSINISIFIVSWIIISMGKAAYSVFVVAILANLAMFIVRLFIVKNLIGLSIKLFFIQVVMPVAGVIILSAIPSFVIKYYLPNGLLFSCIKILFYVAFASVTMCFIGLNKRSRIKIKEIILNKISLK